MLARRQIRLAALAALAPLTPGVTVSSPGDWDTPPAKLPAVQLRVADERKVAWTKTAPEFTTTVTLEILARVDGTSAEVAQDALEALGDAIEIALFGNVAFVNTCQQFSNVSIQSAVTADGDRHVGGISMRIDCETVEEFDPVALNPMLATALLQVGLHIDTIAPFDKTGTYPNPPFPTHVVAAPRTAGPDGRDEAAALIYLPQ